MQMIDVQSGEEIKSGHEMKGIVTFTTALTKLKEIHQQLSTFYGLLFRFSKVLQQNDSQRLKQLGHEMKLTLELANEMLKPGFTGQYTDEMYEKVVIMSFHEIGLNKQHWYLKEIFLLEIEYMLDALSILIEPDFMPIASIDDSSSEENTDRYISSEVKLNVWRRDQGKCVECGSKEKLEYDHIIPVSKGGSNTERNVQLLCQTCNRQKSAAIQ
ncbi:MAG: HNH endonuclease [Candidatus Schekmanbacteria bacterium]|nr:HNH endonuclease [Candidatus Schekmanbacteria bacterium]